jgi:hypothetical protein
MNSILTSRIALLHFAKNNSNDRSRLPYFSENILTDNRKIKSLENRTKHFTIVVEDIFKCTTQAPLCVAVKFSVFKAKCEQRYGKSIDKEMRLKNGLTLIP